MGELSTFHAMTAMRGFVGMTGDDVTPAVLAPDARAGHRNCPRPFSMGKNDGPAAHQQSAESSGQPKRIR